MIGTDQNRLQDLGYRRDVAEIVAGHINVDTVEALVLARNCPLQAAIRIAALDDVPSLVVNYFTSN